MSEQQTAEKLDEFCCMHGHGMTPADQLKLRKIIRQRDLYAAQAKINAQTVIRQAQEMRRLERLLDVEKRALAAEHETQERFR